MPQENRRSHFSRKVHNTEVRESDTSNVSQQ